MSLLLRYGQKRKVDYRAMCTLPGIVLPTGHHLILTSIVGTISYDQDPFIYQTFKVKFKGEWTR